ncbi:hypothetical protein T05_14739 [Trichinella murrelli]|uniref:Uncharacterized protein n=1 Tax=Trichinella murrelli TaxID=144512 RepID=A0A0V0T8M4_9BILA|nr:hypothetical protein T05_14739 [Trichinella murrelli]
MNVRLHQIKNFSYEFYFPFIFAFRIIEICCLSVCIVYTISDSINGGTQFSAESSYLLKHLCTVKMMNNIYH